MVDPIADMLVRIENAQKTNKDSVSVPFSKMKLSIAEVLSKNGFIGEIEKKGKKVSKSLVLGLVYNTDGTPKVHGSKRISKFSRRMYSGAKELRAVKANHGLAVLSTPEGILSGFDARKSNVGGEVLFNIW